MPAGNYLFVRCSGDEAAAALSSIQFIAWLGVRASKVLNYLLRPLSSDNGIVVALFTCLAALVFSGSVRIALLTLSNIQRDGGICVFLAVMFDAHGTSDFFASAFPFIALGLPCVFLLFLGALLGVYLTQAVASWAFGWTHLSIGLLVELAVEPLPFGEHSLTHIDWTEGRGLEGIVHSWTYEHPVAVQRVRNWVEASLSAPPENRSPSLSVR